MGGSGNDLFVYEDRGFGLDEISGFTKGADKIDLSALNLSSLDQLLPFAEDVTGEDATGDVRISLGYGYALTNERITIRNYSVAQFSASDFVFNTSSTDLAVSGTVDFDVLFGGNGNDTLTGSLDNDTLDGGAGSDQLIGGRDNDVLRGGAGNDQLIGGGDNDVLNGGAGNDLFVYNARGFGRDEISDFTKGEDKIDLSALNPGSLDQLLPFAEDVSGNVQISLGYGYVFTNERIVIRNYSVAQLSPSDFVFNTSSTGLAVSGTVDFDVLFGGNGNDTLSGSLGNDTLNGGAGNDTFNGGPGNDLFVYRARGFGQDRITDFTKNSDKIDLAALNVSNLAKILPYAQDAGGNVQITLQNSGTPYRIIIEDYSVAQLTASNFVFGSSSAPLSIVGTAGEDVLFGGSGSDTFTGSAGNDTLDGGSNVDWAVFSGTRASYTIAKSGTGGTVTGSDGSDSISEVEYLQFSDTAIHFPAGAGTNVDFNASPSTYISPIRDFGGNSFGASSGWLRIGAADIQGDGDLEHIYVNRTIGRWATVGPSEDGLVYFGDHGWAGDTRVVGIYIDPLVQSGQVASYSPFDSQWRFQTDLRIENINKVLAANDYDRDGLQEVYFGLTDKTAYLHAYMHADGNIRYANYESQADVINFLSGLGYQPSEWEPWFYS